MYSVCCKRQILVQDRVYFMGKIKTIYELTPLQEGMLYQNIQETEGDYFIQMRLKLNNKNEKIIKSAIQLLVKKHDVLRSAFIYNKVKKPVQVIIEDREAEFVVKRINDKCDIESIEKENIMRGFKLDSDRLFRVHYIQNPSGNDKLVISYPHIIMDGWSNSIIINDLNYFYNELLSGKDYNSLEQQIMSEKNNRGTFSDYLQLLKEQDFVKAKKYWSDLLEGVDSITEIAPIYVNVESDELVKKAMCELTKELEIKIGEKCARKGISKSVFFESAIAVLLSKIIRCEDVVFGKILSGRNYELRNINDIVGMFINTIPERIKINSETMVDSLLNEVNQQFFDSLENSYVGLSEIQKNHVLGSNLIKILYTYENYPESENEEDFFFEIEDFREQTDYSIGFIVAEDKCGIVVSVLFNPKMYTDEEINNILSRLNFVLSAMVENDVRVSDIEVVDQHEIEKIKGFGNSEENYSPKVIGDLLKEVVKQNSDKIAVIDKNTSLTFSEFNNKINSLAQHLCEYGVRKGEKIVVYSTRSIETLCSFFAITKLGACYVPVDNSIPVERLKVIINDCGAHLLLKMTDKVVIEKNRDVKEINILDSQLYCSTQIDVEKNNECHVDVRDDAYCIYTSGTS